MKKTLIFCIAITILEFIVAIAFYQRLPQIIPIHWGVSGQVDGYGGKMMIFLAPCISLFLTLGMYYMPKFDPKGENIIRSGKAYPAVMILMNLIMVVILTVTILTSFGHNVPVGKIIPISVGIMLLLLGNYLPKVKPNYFFGIRTPWTLANETVWTKTHRFGGWIFFAIGILFVGGTILPVPYNFGVPISGMFIGIIIISIYSYRVYKKILQDSLKK